MEGQWSPAGVSGQPPTLRSGRCGRRERLGTAGHLEHGEGLRAQEMGRQTLWGRAPGAVKHQAGSATLGQPGRRHLGVPGTGMETAQQMSFCKTGGAAGAAESWGGGCGGSGRSTQRTCWRESPRQYRGDAG